MSLVNPLAAQQAWQTPTLQNGWVNYGGAYNVAGYWKDAFGVVHLRGYLASGTTDAIIFTLPSGYRPTATGRFLSASGTSTGLGYTDIDSSGNVKGVGNANSYHSLEGITFRTS